MRLYPLAILALAACGSSSAPTGDLEVVTTVSPAAFRVGESVTVTVGIINRSDAPRTIDANGCPSPFIVTTTDGTIVAPAEQICSLGAVTKTLAPGERYERTENWTGRARAGDIHAPATFLSPGSYVVRGLIYGPGVTTVSATVQIKP
jgi:hypothetical protein